MEMMPNSSCVCPNIQINLWVLNCVQLVISSQKALETMEGVLRHVNDVMHSCGIKGFPGNLAEQGKLLLQNSFMVWETNKTLSLLPLKAGKQRQVFLYQKMIIFSKKIDVQETSKDAVVYQYKKDVKVIFAE